MNIIVTEKHLDKAIANRQRGHFCVNTECVMAVAINEAVEGFDRMGYDTFFTNQDIAWTNRTCTSAKITKLFDGHQHDALRKILPTVITFERVM